MTFRIWATLILLLFLVCRAQFSAAPPTRRFQQAVPPTMVTGLLGIFYPKSVSE